MQKKRADPADPSHWVFIPVTLGVYTHRIWGQGNAAQDRRGFLAT
ncbi:hypothetical protein H1P_1290015 [Hyella patelloides LEGE 07179]|uniref:Uncharacterized protein n=1 Tax=Hyella patelloides LEGE 07179 TaxID=945734 RepID=A0A563VKZ0_9CYAN|nr:hypothetical protein H1P_1290015 [Hyella patelloides LEGE 07179]